MGVTFLKRDRHGKGKILSQQEIQLLFSQGLTNVRDRCLFAIMMFIAFNHPQEKYQTETRHPHPPHYPRVADNPSGLRKRSRTRVLVSWSKRRTYHE